MVSSVCSLPAEARAEDATNQPLQITGQVTARRGAILRAGPGRSYRPVTVLPYNAVVQLTGRSAPQLVAAMWYQAMLEDGRAGWVLSSQVQLRGNAQDLPVVDFVSVPAAPTLSESVGAKTSVSGPLTGVDLAKLKAVFRQGQTMGRRARVFSKVGDSTVRDQDFLYGFGLGRYQLGPQQYLQRTIDFFSMPIRPGVANSFVNKSLAATPAFNSAAAFDASWTAWTDPDQRCLPNEGPLDCEFRVVQPSVVLVKLGLEDMFVMTAADYRGYMVRIVRHSLTQGIIPVLCTFASNPKEPKYPMAGTVAEQMNQTLREIAAQEGVPLLELREPVMRLPDLGLNAEGIHVSDWGGDPYNFNGDDQRWGITLVNLLTLQMLDKLRVEVLTS